MTTKALMTKATMIEAVTLKLERVRLNIVSALRTKKAVRTVNIIACGFVAFFGAFFLLSSIADAFTAPASTSFAYSLYTIGVTDVLQGPIGFLGGVSAIVLGAIMAIQQKIMMAIPCLLGGAALMSADTLLTSLGLTF